MTTTIQDVTPAPIIEIQIRGEGGQGAATFPLTEWRGMSAVARVLGIHEQCRAVTRGKPFDVLKEHRPCGVCQRRHKSNAERFAQMPEGHRKVFGPLPVPACDWCR